MTRSGFALVSLTVLPNVAGDLRLLGWTTNRGFLNDAVADAVVELVERAIALGYGRRDRLIGIAGRRKIRIALIVNSALALSTTRLHLSYFRWFASASISALAGGFPRWPTPYRRAAGSASRPAAEGDRSVPRVGRRSRGRSPHGSRNAVRHSAGRALWSCGRSADTETTNAARHRLARSRGGAVTWT